MSVYVKITVDMAEIMNQRSKGNKFFENQEIELSMFLSYLEEINLLKKKEILYYVSK